MEYKEVFEYRDFRSRYNSIYFRFRFDPVPYTACTNYGHYYKRPRTTQERRLSFKDKEYVRPRRNYRTLVNSWDDYVRSDLKIKRSWKKKKVRKQWMKNI